MKTYKSDVPVEQRTRRALIVHKSHCSYGNLGCVFFALNGSPPEGYALFVPMEEYILIIDATGNVRKRITGEMGVTIEGLKDLSVNDIVPGSPEDII